MNFVFIRYKYVYMLIIIWYWLKVVDDNEIEDECGNLSLV